MNTSHLTEVARDQPVVGITLGGRLWPAVDAFAVIILSGIVILVVSVWLVGRYYPGSGLEQVGLRSARQIVETREELEAEDLQQMLAAHNERRRARGEAELSETDLELRVAKDMREQERRRKEYLEDRDLEQLLEATNARRRARGLSERTLEEARREFGERPTDGTGRSAEDA